MRTVSATPQTHEPAERRRRARRTGMLRAPTLFQVLHGVTVSILRRARAVQSMVTARRLKGSTLSSGPAPSVDTCRSPRHTPAPFSRAKALNAGHHTRRHFLHA
eukprot:TRINITY_DN589_c1_g1_i2.p2 TRINITY_DN589_c1_g1~~TRINITY_DN589_c1_g1_i2.p2  ORF type:complete len:104 (-),score=6.86 TRINITY_DN589_c1_g1_i2:441-752(-)